MELLIADAFPEDRRQALEAGGHRITYRPELTGDALPDAIAGIDGLVVRSTRVGAETIAAADTLTLIVRAGAGTDTIDITAATAAGIQVSNVPGKNAAAVAELAMGLIIAIDRSIPDNVAELRAGRWDKQRFSVARGIHGRHLGIVGLGMTGLALAERARAFGMHLSALDKPRPAEMEEQIARHGFELVPDLMELAEACDVVSFHVPYTDATEHVIDGDFLDHMQRGAILINVSRAEIVDEDALLRALEEKGIRAGLDVFAGEPAGKQGTIDSALAAHPNVYGTHHIGASTQQAQGAVADEVVRIIQAHERGEALHPVAGR